MNPGGEGLDSKLKVTDEPRRLPAGTVVQDHARSAAYEVQKDGSYKRVTPKPSVKRIKKMLRQKVKGSGPQTGWKETTKQKKRREAKAKARTEVTHVS